jgi:DNA-binding NarL/FixJ family response regulator
VNSVEEMLLAGSSRSESAMLSKGCDAIQDFQGDGGPRPASAEPGLHEACRLPDARLASLTRREREVLDLLVEGCTCPQIASALYVAPSTVCFHVRHIYEKLQVHTRGQAVAYALGRGRS